MYMHLRYRLLLLVNGEVTYLGDAEKGVAYFEAMGFKCPPQMNPAEYLGMPN